MDKSEARRRHYLQTMGIEVWQRREPPVTVAMLAPADVATAEAPRSPSMLVAEGVVTDIMAMDWPSLEQAVRSCTRCPLHTTRTQGVVGVGNRQAAWMIIGEAPGAEEDRQGEPFVGRAGQLLNAMLKAIGLAREQVYIANILKSRPPHNRDPLPQEVAACTPFLMRQIHLIQPKIILALGRIAAQNLLQTDSKLGALRGRRHTCPGSAIPVVVTYHPAYLLRAPAEKRKAWEDLQYACKLFRGEG